ncbi:lipopolysaccharide biosynthesis protein [Blattabacterium sp. (Blaberus giganteus)]|uniref:lipopolysaccharide biosynthesis protein n=1 Tax=Blattabacterium sp. (Blaberus giganteus) TaxID=1186051 RepID=UPI00025F7070|nr:oligosaccharide flippase family protein [Blattabacterium sp. (Blaberus giganteus)]AFJ90490.1 polysaccharide biosynthesis protein [Blattabacterium sp. (Blaberus giganteus)]
MYKKLAIQTIVYSIGFIFPRIVNYAFLKFFTISFKREEFSLYTDMYALSFMIIGFLSFGLESTYFRFLYKKNYNKEIVFSTGVIMQLLISSFFFIISINSIKYISYIAGYQNHTEYFLMFFLIIFFDTVCILPMAWLRVNDKYLQYSAINIINILIQSFIIICLFFCENGMDGRKTFFFFIFKWVNSFTDKIGYIFFANMISSLINLFLIFPILLKKVTIRKFNKILAINMLNYGGPIMLGTIAFSINENLDKILIKRCVSDEINGSYSACYKIATFMSLYIRMFRLGIEPFFFKKSKDSDARYYYEEITYIFVLFGLIFYVLICGNINMFMKFLIDKKYHIAIPIIPIIMMGNLFLGVYTNLSIFYKIIDKPIIGTYISLIGVLITFLFNTIFIFIFNNSFMIPAWGTFTSYGTMLIVLYIWGKKKFIKFCNKKIRNIIIHFLFAIFIVFMIKIKKEMELNLFLQFLYLIVIFLLEKKRLINLIK